jgi:hypothetical protein
MENGILSTDFRCIKKESCSDNSDKFTGPKSAYVGSNYEIGELPRILFLSLDSGSGDKKPEERLPEQVREQEEVMQDVSKLPKNKHWYLTHEIAFYFLKRYMDGLTILNVKHYFAHANSAKCSVNNKGNSIAPSKMFINCRMYLHGELSILDPEIIITQGNQAKWSLQEIIDREIEKKDDYCTIIELSGKEIFWLHTYHPRSYKNFYKQRHKINGIAEGWEKYSAMAQEFISHKRKTNVF